MNKKWPDETGRLFQILKQHKDPVRKVCLDDKVVVYPAYDLLPRRSAFVPPPRDKIDSSIEHFVATGHLRSQHGRKEDL